MDQDLPCHPSGRTCRGRSGSPSEMGRLPINELTSGMELLEGTEVPIGLRRALCGVVQTSKAKFARESQVPQLPASRLGKCAHDTAQNGLCDLM